MRFLLSLLLGLTAFAENALAQGVGGTNVVPKLKNPLGEGTGFTELVDRIINFLLPIATVAVSAMVLIGGMQMMFAGGKPENFSKGKKTVLYAAIGYVVVLVSKGVTSLIKSILGAPAQ